MNIPQRGAPLLRLSALASAALLIHGYHLGADDAAIYVPGIKRAFDPGLYSFGSQFFTMHSGLSLFCTLVGGSARLMHLPIDWVILLWHWVGLLLLLVGAWRLLSVCFQSDLARWGGVALLAATLGVPRFSRASTSGMRMVVELAMAVSGFRCQVSGVRGEARVSLLTPDT